MVNYRLARIESKKPVRGFCTDYSFAILIFCIFLSVFLITSSSIGEGGRGWEEDGECVILDEKDGWMDGPTLSLV